MSLEKDLIELESLLGFKPLNKSHPNENRQYPSGIETLVSNIQKSFRNFLRKFKGERR